MAEISDVSMKQLRYFVAACETRQFSKAAAEVHVSQSAVTSAVHQLEERMGVKLFIRQPHGVEMTAEGHQFYQHARHILDTLQDALGEPQFQQHGVSGTVSLAASYTVLGYFLPNLLARFKRSYPNIDIKLMDMDRQHIEDGVLEGSVNLGVTIISNSERRESFGHHVLIRSRRQIWLAADHPLTQLPKITLKDIARQDYIIPTVDEGEASAARYWKAHELQPNIIFRTSSMEALRAYVAYGFGVTILSDMIYRPWSLEGKKIICRPVDAEIPPMELGLIWNREQTLSDATKAFQDFLIQSSGA